MTNPYYNEAFTGQPGQTARAESVKSELDGVEAGFDGTYVDTQRSIKGPIGEPAMNDLPAFSVRKNQWIRFDANGQPIVVPSPLNNRGPWVAARLYQTGDTFTAAPNGSTYYVNTSYTSGATFGATDLANTYRMIDLTGLLLNNYSVVTGGTAPQLIAGQAVFADSTVGNITFNLPVNPVLGDSPVTITHVGGTLAAGQAITIQSAGQKIMGTVENVMSMDVANFSIVLSYAGAAYGWRVRMVG
jgi:hypothetical protein